MKTFLFKLFLLITFFVLSSSVLLAQVNWTKYEGNPVITVPGAWYNGAFAPYVIYNADSSRYEMFFTGASTAGGGRPCRIGLAYSYDGLSWQVRSTPVLTPSAGQWDSYTVELPYVIYENGSYKMWYSGALSSTSYKIGYATSPDGINWTKHLTPVLEAGTDAWEAEGVAGSYVMPVAGGYKMWYVGANSGMSKLCVGYATSADGILWQKDTQNNPILEPGISGEWDDTWVTKPSVMFKDNIYYMWYLGTGTSWGQFRIGLATSPNGINNWTKYPANPVLRPSVSGWDGGEVESPSVLLVGDTLYMYYDGSPSGNYVWKIGLAKSLYSPPLTPGTYTVGTGGNFATIQEAFDKLETDGVTGNVTLELIDELYTATSDSFGFKLNGPIPGAGPNSRVTIKPAENKNVLIEGNANFVMTCVNTSYMTVDGVSISGVTTLTFHAYKNAQYTWNGCLGYKNNSDHNIVQNVIFISDDIYGYGTGPSFETLQGSSATADSNLIQNNFIKKAGCGIYVSSELTSSRATGNIIRGNYVGSETDSLIGWGIQIEHCQNTIVENNIVQNLKVTHTIGEIVNMGINSWRGSNVIIRNNVVHGIKSKAGYMTVGILLSGTGGSDCQISNNIVFDIQSSSTNTESRVSGIQMFYQSNPKVYYNTVYLSGTGENHLGSAALYIYYSVTNADVKNNVFVNTRDEGQYCASAVYSNTTGSINSDYNDLYYNTTNANNCLVRIGTSHMNTLADWQATGRDLHSYVEMPHFISSTDLHIDPNFTTYLESRGTPIAGIDTDFDGQTRHATNPDIGADEFNGIAVGVEEEETLPTEFAMLQNYPNPFNPNTSISWQSPVGSHQTIKVFDVSGNEIATLVDEYKPAGRYEVEFDASRLASGIYFYQLQAGEYTAVKKMILLK
ncbi:MAG: T9SS type A sorting domain-containing protein [Ignavibacteriaceae bacterium]